MAGDVTVSGVREEGHRVNRYKSEVKRRFRVTEHETQGSTPPHSGDSSAVEQHH